MNAPRTVWLYNSADWDDLRDLFATYSWDSICFSSHDPSKICRYGDQSSNKKSHLDANNINEENFHQNVGEHLGNVDSKVAHHKGHHKSGFQNSYHKDESGSNSSYFDDGSDLADEQVHKNYRGSYGDADQRRQNVGRYDSSNFANDQARQGVYDNAGRYENDEGNRRNYNRRNYYNDREDLSRKNLGNNYNSGGHYAEEKYLERPYPIEPLPYRHETDLPHYHDESYRRPLVSHHPREHITVYEDPRYVHSDPRYRRSDDYIDDYIELDVGSPLEGDPYIRRYEEQRPLYYYD